MTLKWTALLNVRMLWRCDAVCWIADRFISFAAIVVTVARSGELRRPLVGVRLTAGRVPRLPELFVPFHATSVTTFGAGLFVEWIVALFADFGMKMRRTSHTHLAAADAFCARRDSCHGQQQFQFQSTSVVVDDNGAGRSMGDVRLQSHTNVTSYNHLAIAPPQVH